MRGWITAALLVAVAVNTAATQGTSFPGRLESYLTRAVKLTESERQLLLKGEPLAKLLPADESKEVAVFGAVWVNASMRRYVEALTDIENFERGGGFKVTKRISAPPRVEDFSALRLPDEDLDALRTCKVDACEVKLGEQALKRFNTQVNWGGPDARVAANTLMQRLAFEYADAYLGGGNKQLAIYRDSSRPTSVDQEFQAMVAQMPELTTHMPDIRRYLLDYPAVTLPNSTSFLYWQETAFGLKPTIRLSHLTIRETADDTVVTSKMLYASHYFWTGLELRVLMPDPSRGSGFWFVTVNRSRSDGLSGLTGKVVRSRVRAEVQEGTLAGLRSMKRRLENQR